MAGAIAFNVLVAIIPLLLASLGITGQILQRTVADPAQVLLDLLLNTLPPVSPQFENETREAMRTLLSKSGSFTIIGLLLLIWVSTRLIGTLRAALREVFDIGEDRSIIAGKLFDIKMVVTAGTLFTINVTLTVVVGLVKDLGFRYLHLRELSMFQAIYLGVLSFVSAWVMFLLIYRYLPYRRIQWRTALVAASFTTIMFELLKRAFGLYVSNFADYSSTYGNLANLVILFLWVYYMATIFILGGEVGQVASLRRIRKQQKERLG